MARLIEWLEKVANLKTVVILVMAILPFNILLFPYVSGRLEAISGYRLMDTLFWYTPQEVFTRLEAYQSSGRTIYLISDWTVDLLYPFIYAFLSACVLTILLRNGFPEDHPLRRMQLLPFMMMVFDYLENFAISLLLVLYPAKPVLVARIASTFTTLKWCFAVFSLTALLIGIAGLIVVAMRSSRAKGD